MTAGFAPSPIPQTTFLRAVHCPFPAVVSCLERMWEQGQQGGYVGTGRGHQVGLVHADPVHGGAAASLDVRLRPNRRRSRRRWRMELLIEPWAVPGVSRFELVPRGRVRLTRRYAGAGHDLLDALRSTAESIEVPRKVSART